MQHAAAALKGNPAAPCTCVFKHHVDKGNVGMVKVFWMAQRKHHPEAIMWLNLFFRSYPVNYLFATTL